MKPQNDAFVYRIEADALDGAPAYVSVHVYIGVSDGMGVSFWLLIF